MYQVLQNITIFWDSIGNIQNRKFISELQLCFQVPQNITVTYYSNSNTLNAKQHLSMKNNICCNRTIREQSFGTQTN